MEIEHLSCFCDFLTKHLKDASYDTDAWLEKLIIHWGETGEDRFVLPADLTKSGRSAAIGYSVKNRYYIIENGAEREIDDSSDGYDIYRPCLSFSPARVAAAPKAAPRNALNPLVLIRHRCGMTQKALAERSGLSLAQIRALEKAGQDFSALPLGQAAALAAALHVHAEDLLSCAPTAPAGR